MRYHIHVVLWKGGEYHTPGCRTPGQVNARMIVDVLSKNQGVKRLVVSPMDIGEDRVEYIGQRLQNGDWEVVHDELVGVPMGTAENDNGPGWPSGAIIPHKEEKGVPVFYHINDQVVK